jgi:hypothetical protein
MTAKLEKFGFSETIGSTAYNSRHPRVKKLSRRSHAAKFDILIEQVFNISAVMVVHATTV